MIIDAINIKFIFFPRQENVSLIKEINDLRRELKIARTQVHDLEAALGINKKNKTPVQDLTSIPNGSIVSGLASREGRNDENVKIIEMQREEIRKLRTALTDAEQFATQRPPSGARLPPVLAQ